MAKISFTDENPQEEVLKEQKEFNEVEIETGNKIDEFEPEHIIDEPVNNNGLSMEEMNDSNKIKVNIADYNTPLVILFGPPACGKTMTMIRLTRYLQMKGFSIQPDTSFRPAYDKNYIDLCENFNELINSENAAVGNSKINFMLVQVRWQGRPICQILEAPGEDYFNPQNPNAAFPKYINAINNSNNRKIWAIMTEPDVTCSQMMKDPTKRSLYVNKIANFKSKMHPKDKVMFIFNKVDATPFVIGPGRVKYDLLLNQTNYLYPNIFVPFKNVNPISRIWRPYNFDFVAFQTGDYSKATDGTLTFQQGPDVYPAKLWEVIYKRLRG